MRRPLVMLCVLALTGALAGCSLGSDDASPDEDSDVRTMVMDCFEEEGIDARAVGDDEAVVGDGPGAPRLKFFLTSGESEAAQFKGDAEGAEQIGKALLYVGDGSDELLEDVEYCAAQQ
jgi:hypothetical protein